MINDSFRLKTCIDFIDDMGLDCDELWTLIEQIKIIRETASCKEDIDSNNWIDEVKNNN